MRNQSSHQQSIYNSAWLVLAALGLIGVLATSSGCGRASVNNGTTVINNNSGGATTDPAPTTLSYPLTSVTYVNGQTIPSNTPTTDGTNVTYSISPDLTADTGLTFNTSTGVISGSPTSNHASTTYTITVTTSGGSTTYDVIIGVASGFVVTSTADTSDFATADGFCDTNDSAGDGPCTLRAAAEQANFTGGTQAIFLPAGTITVDTTTITLGAAGLTTLTITGQGVGTSIISGGNTAPRVFLKSSASNVTISEVTLTQGRDASNGGFVQHNGTGTLTLKNCSITDNRITTNGTGGGAIGGALATSSISIDNCTISNNRATDYAGAIGTYGPLTIANSTISNNGHTNGNGQAGGALWSENTSNISNTTFDSNFGGGGSGGGAVYLSSTAAMTVTNSTFSNNDSYNAGGAIRMAANSTFTATDTTFNGNDATISGGAIYLVGGASGSVSLSRTVFFGNTAAVCSAIAVNSGPVTAVNSTFSGNYATNNGTLCTEGTGTSSITLRQSTVANNTTSATAQTAGVNVGAGDTITLVQTIVANNTVNGGLDNCQRTGTMTASAYNLTDSAAADCNLTGTSLASQDVSDLATSVANNGGSVYTVAVGDSDFPGVDAVPSGSCFSLVDARNVVRPRDGDGDATSDCDIGAFEF